MHVKRLKLKKQAPLPDDILDMYYLLKGNCGPYPEPYQDADPCMLSPICNAAGTPRSATRASQTSKTPQIQQSSTRGNIKKVDRHAQPCESNCKQPHCDLNTWQKNNIGQLYDSHDKLNPDVQDTASKLGDFVLHEDDDPRPVNGSKNGRLSHGSKQYKSSRPTKQPFHRYYRAHQYQTDNNLQSPSQSQSQSQIQTNIQSQNHLHSYAKPKCSLTTGVSLQDSISETSSPKEHIPGLIPTPASSTGSYSHSQNVSQSKNQPEVIYFAAANVLQQWSELSTHLSPTSDKSYSQLQMDGPMYTNLTSPDEGFTANATNSNNGSNFNDSAGDFEFLLDTFSFEHHNHSNSRLIQSGPRPPASTSTGSNEGIGIYDSFQSHSNCATSTVHFQDCAATNNTNSHCPRHNRHESSTTAPAATENSFQTRSSVASAQSLSISPTTTATSVDSPNHYSLKNYSYSGNHHGQLQQQLLPRVRPHQQQQQQQRLNDGFTELQPKRMPSFQYRQDYRSRRRESSDESRVSSNETAPMQRNATIDAGIPPSVPPHSLPPHRAQSSPTRKGSDLRRRKSIHRKSWAPDSPYAEQLYTRKCSYQANADTKFANRLSTMSLENIDAVKQKLSSHCMAKNNSVRKSAAQPPPRESVTKSKRSIESHPIVTKLDDPVEIERRPPQPQQQQPGNAKNGPKSATTPAPVTNTVTNSSNALLKKKRKKKSCSTSVCEQDIVTERLSQTCQFLPDSELARQCDPYDVYFFGKKAAGTHVMRALWDNRLQQYIDCDED